MGENEQPTHQQENEPDASSVSSASAETLVKENAELKNALDAVSSALHEARREAA